MSLDRSSLADTYRAGLKRQTATDIRGQRSRQHADQTVPAFAKLHHVSVAFQAPNAMATHKDIDFTYSLTDRVIRLSLGELADFSGAKYDGDFSLSLEQAQHRKHDYVAEQIGIAPGRRLLDLGCGWGALLDYVRGHGGTGVGVTLSSAQLAACRRFGLDVRLHDAREVDRARFGVFDGSRASERLSTSALRTSTKPGARRRSTAAYSSAWRACCPTPVASIYRRWCSARTC